MLRFHPLNLLGAFLVLSISSFSAAQVLQDADGYGGAFFSVVADQTGEDLAVEEISFAEFDSAEGKFGANRDECAACTPKNYTSKKSPPSKAATAHKPVFYDNDFSYLDNPSYQGRSYLGDSLKRMDVGPGWKLDIGGQYRMRYQNENNIRGLGLTGRDDSFVLHRTRLYSNLEMGDTIRVYAEMIDAVSQDEDFNPRPIEEDRADILNLFVDVKLIDNGATKLTTRVGRQELLYGAQRLVSPLDWANTRRTFEGYKFMLERSQWDVDAFWVRPVGNPAKSFNSPDQSQEFMGIYTKYKNLKNSKLDLYYLRYLETDVTSFEFNTFGGRLEGGYGNWLWDSEVDYQFGKVGAADQVAWAYTFGLGRKLGWLPWSPTIWAYYDFADGNDDGNGFNHLFPLSHKYLGFMDLFGRRNIEDLNFRLNVSPTKKMTALLWWHIFNLQNANDIPYSVAMTPSPSSPGGIVPGGRTDLGQELDLLMSYKTSERSNLVLGYSHFFSGDFFSTNPTGGLFDGDANFYYVQFTENF